MRHASFLAVIAMTALLCGCLCGSAPDKETTKVAGEAMASNNPELCKTLNTTEKIDDCYEQVAVGLRNSDICKRLSAEYLIDSCMYEVGAKTKSFGPCLEIKSDEQKAACIALVASAQAENLKDGAGEEWDKVKSFFGGEKSPCASYISNNTASDNCYLYSAVNMNRSGDCANIMDNDQRVDCYRKIAVVKNDDGICLKQENADDRDKCLYNSAFVSDDPAFCYNIQSDFYREKCFKQSGIKS
ncbi:MAG: hypothetical protein PHG85_06665 [Candidatus Altiarchaeota archaeon]|nr:hypothetical protein [Candidatus Altiarchaeota archaeon]